MSGVPLPSSQGGWKLDYSNQEGDPLRRFDQFLTQNNCGYVEEKEEVLQRVFACGFAFRENVMLVSPQILGKYMKICWHNVINLLNDIGWAQVGKCDVATLTLNGLPDQLRWALTAAPSSNFFQMRCRPESLAERVTPLEGAPNEMKTEKAIQLSEGPTEAQWNYWNRHWGTVREDLENFGQFLVRENFANSLDPREVVHGFLKYGFVYQDNCMIANPIVLAKRVGKNPDMITPMLACIGWIPLGDMISVRAFHREPLSCVSDMVGYDGIARFARGSALKREFVRRRKYNIALSVYKFEEQLRQEQVLQSTRAFHPGFVYDPAAISRRVMEYESQLERAQDWAADFREKDILDRARIMSQYEPNPGLNSLEFVEFGLEETTEQLPEAQGKEQLDLREGEFEGAEGPAAESEEECCGELVTKENCEEEFRAAQEDCERQLPIPPDRVGELTKKVDELNALQSSDKIEETTPVRHSIIQELCLLDSRTTPNGHASNGNRYSPRLKDLCVATLSLSRKGYNLMREALPLPSERILSTHSKQIKAAIQKALKGERRAIDPYLQAYRKRLGIAENEVVYVILAHDATMVTETGLRERAKDGETKQSQKRKVVEYCHTFLMLPLNRKYTDLVIRSMGRMNGNIGDDVIKEEDRLIAELEKHNFCVIGIATDGDTAVNARHEKFYNECHKGSTLHFDLAKLIPQLRRRYKDGIMTRMPITDLFHWFKNCRMRLLNSSAGLSIGPELPTVTVDSIMESLHMEEKTNVFENRSGLDSLKDCLALELFKLDNLVQVGESGNIIGFFYLLPLVALNIAVRCPSISIQTRLDLINLAHRELMGQLQTMPEKMPQNNSKANPRPTTLWTRNMLYRSCNLCVTLYWACSYWKEQQEDPKIKEKIDLPLNRLGTHMLECFFGICRSSEHDDVRMKKMLEVQATGVMIQEIMMKLELHPYIRRHKIDAGCTLTGDNLDGVTIDFSGCMRGIDLINVRVTEQQKMEAKTKEFEETNGYQEADGDPEGLRFMYDESVRKYNAHCDELVGPFRDLLNELTRVGDKFVKSKVVKTSELSNPRMYWTKKTSNGKMAWQV
jgi:hypothetical protein